MSPAIALVEPTQFVGLVALAAGLISSVWLTHLLQPRQRGPLALVAIVGLSFQVFHGLEHAIQFGRWVQHPRRPPWMSEWAMLGRDSIASLIGRSPATGNELLHLAGNAIFLTGLIAGGRVMFGARRPAGWRRARQVQTVHLAEHVMLSVTSLTLGRSLGVTTLFGLVAPTSATGIAVRVGSHFALNAVPTLLCARVTFHELRGFDRRHEAIPAVARSR